MRTWSEEAEWLAGRIIDLTGQCQAGHRRVNTCPLCAPLYDVAEKLLAIAKSGKELETKQGTEHA